jgi:uncharacterized protein
MRVERVFSIRQVDEAAWRAIEPPDFPFFDLEFLGALERSRSVGRRSGWSPVYLLCRDGERILGALPMYLKTDSYGEYVFDWAWANAYHEHGLPYYPKLVSAVPFTPATGPKLLVRPGTDRAQVANDLLAATRKLADESGASSTHALFLPESERDEFEERGFAIRHSLQFHWRNCGYGEFQDYLDAMTSKRRRQVARERRQIEGVQVEHLTGEALLPEHAALMYRFYVDTYDRKWGSPYLTKGFFDEVFRTMRDRIMLAIARDELTRRPVAGALFFFKGDALFGRYWGAVKDVRNLHFELCYYQGIEFAVERGMTLFEAGAQGEHKLARGFLPAVMYSAHDIRHPAFRRAIEHYIAEEREMISYQLAEYMDHDPYKR